MSIPILPDIREELLDYLIRPERLPIHEYERNQEYWPREINPNTLFNYDNAPLSTTIKMQRDLTTGEIIKYIEVPIKSTGSNAKNSLSLNRAPGPPSESIWGSVSNFPFWPGGLDVTEELPNVESFNADELLTVAPGLSRGMEFNKDGSKLEKIENIVNLLDVAQQDYDLLGLWKNIEKEVVTESATEKKTTTDIPEEVDVLPKEIPILRISQHSDFAYERQGTEWAILLDTSQPVKNFSKKVPEMAIEYEFELDTFQKLAIIELEKHNNVFVAAHTSAGKTVVAEYAIALSQKHMTRTIYTSPIKALSNQKYRDFKRKFDDVGLVTGDFQINMKGSCLIMTTEILRSMLYCGSDVTRDLEYVIFDEVHYVNDKERGHVWEQVLIMLPAHVCVVLLSATVPNTIEFADWLGRTYQKKVYVITTLKRPVPLNHYLYTGSGGSTRDNRYLILNSQGSFLTEGYMEAKLSFEKKQDKKEKQHSVVPIKKNYLNPKQEKTMLEGLIGHLQKHRLMPVVAFTFSRKKCDLNAENLKRLDLTTATEKFHITTFFMQCISSLKPPDRDIPQITIMKESLIRGIGVHHSGILPIIKEMVEMLFQKQLIKFLFATETFAMGVNMPARTVIFDSITKHDGSELRSLKTAEYIQMAGRAGRRGLDEAGTVIILCKGEVPHVDNLKKMMLGKPEKLSSQFKVTYGMVLTLLRVESLSVESMMNRSFCEAYHQKQLEGIRTQLTDVENQLKENHSKELSQYMKPLTEFYKAASNYLNGLADTMPSLLKTIGALPGRVVLITHKSHIKKFALILNSSWKVLVLNNKTSTVDSDEHPDKWYKMLALVNDNLFAPDGSTNHEVLKISEGDVFEVTTKLIKVDTNIIIRDWEKRQIPRFRDDPPGQTCMAAIQELLKLTLNTIDKNNSENRASYFDFIGDCNERDLDLHEQANNLKKLKENLLNHISSTQIPNFEEQFLVVFSKMILEDQREELKYRLSSAHRELFQDYERRICVLKELNYVNSEYRVQLKGMVACEMGMNELLITELVLRNIFTDLKPAEVAALLSALVFQAKTKTVLDLPEQLKKGIEQIEEVQREIKNLENMYHINNSDVHTLNFGLTQVVYEWANAKPFANLMELTDVQEGIIVRCIQQLNETICDVKSVAKLTGDPKLYNKMEEASQAIKRDIVFAASLYTQNKTV